MHVNFVELIDWSNLLIDKYTTVGTKINNNWTFEKGPDIKKQ